MFGEARDFNSFSYYLYYHIIITNIAFINAQMLLSTKLYCFFLCLFVLSKSICTVHTPSKRNRIISEWKLSSFCAVSSQNKKCAFFCYFWRIRCLNSISINKLAHQMFACLFIYIYMHLVLPRDSCRSTFASQIDFFPVHLLLSY